MMMFPFKPKAGLLLCYLLLCQLALRAQVSFTASVTPTTIGKNETTTLRLMIENARQVEQIIPPSLDDFEVLSGPNQESGMESTNGVTRQYIGITYVLRPKTTGRFVIRDAIAKADGKSLRSNPVTIRVSSKATGNSQPYRGSPFSGFPGFEEPVVQSSFDDYIIRKGENITEKIDKNIFIKVETSKPSCFVGEPVVVTYKLYTRLKSESSITKNPSFNGFSVIDLLPPGNNYYSVEKLNGREYNVYTLRKSQLYALQAGDIALESAEVENDIHFIKEEYLDTRRGGIDDMFRDFTHTNIPAAGIHDEKVTLQSKPAVIQVKPLPEAGKPVSFNGAVGNFTIQAMVDQTSFTTNDAARLSVAITGEGNMSMIIAPDIEWPSGIEPYDSRAREQVNKLTVPVSGTKYFDIPFTVADSGTYQLPPIQFSFFDIATGSYKKISSQPITLRVSKGTGQPTTSLEGLPARTGKGQFLDTLFTNRWLIVVPIAILIITGLFIWVMKDRKKQLPLAGSSGNGGGLPTGPEPLPVETPAPGLNPLMLTEEKLYSGDNSSFYQVLNVELKNFLANHFDIPLATIDKNSIVQKADAMGLPLHTVLQLQELLDGIEWQLYTPFAAENKREELYTRAKAMVQALAPVSP